MSHFDLLDVKKELDYIVAQVLHLPHIFRTVLNCLAQGIKTAVIKPPLMKIHVISNYWF